MNNAPPRREHNPTFLADILHIAALWCLAVAQPALSVLSGRPEFFLAHGAGKTEVILYAFGLCLGFPALLSLMLMASGLGGRRAQSFLAGIFIAALTGILLLPVLKNWNWMPGVALAGVSAFLGIVVAFARWKVSMVSWFFHFLTPAILIVPAVFLLDSRVQRGFQTTSLQRVATQSRTPVVLIVADAFPVTSFMGPDRGIDSIRYRNFARLAQMSTWYRNAMTVSDETVFAVPAILSGRNPVAGKLPSSFDYPQNLLEILSDSYDIQAVETQTQLHRAKKKTHAAQILQELLLDTAAVFLRVVSPEDLADRLPSISGKWGNFWNRDSRNVFANRQQAFDVFLNSIQKNSGKPPFYFLHILLPHEPFEFLPSAKLYNSDRHGTPDEGAANTPAAEEAYNEHCIRHYQRHLLQLEYTDLLLGRLLDRMEQTGILDSSLLILTADHGESHWPHTSLRAVSDKSYADILGVPLFVKMPFQKQAVVSELNVRTTDIYPTVLETLGVQAPKSDGISLRNEQPRERVLPVFASAFRNDPVIWTVQPDMELKYKTLERKIALFSSGDSELLYRIGPYPELLGRTASELLTEEASSVQLDLFDAPEFQHVNRASGIVPCFVRGMLLDANQCDGTTLAIAVNGRVEAVTRPSRRWLAKNKSVVCQFGALVPESSLREGPNDVAIYVLESGKLKRATVAR